MKTKLIEELQQEIAADKVRIKELIQINEELTDFIENAALPLHWVNHLGIITWANQAELSALGYEKDEYIGQPISAFHADAEIIEDILFRLKNNETLHNYRARLKCKDGSIKHVLISSNVLTRDGKFIHTRCFTRDVTAIVQEEQRKNDFVSMVSHELKTPLTSILAFIQVMLSRSAKSGDAFITQSLRRTEKLALGMTKMINDFLHISRLEQTEVNLNIESLELHLLIQEVVQELQLTHHSHNIKLIHSGQVRIAADYAKISQVLINLISNAIKYSPESSTITVGYEPEGSRVKIFVQDKGIGIAKADQKKLFQRFQRIENLATKHTTGFGIGLYLVAEFLRYHNSIIQVDSKQGEGSTFYFFLDIDHQD